MPEALSPIGVFVASFGVSAFAGLAALLRSGVPLNWKVASTSLLNSGCLGLGIALVWYNAYQDNIYFLVGVCLLSGLGGMTTIEFVLDAVRRFSVGFLPGSRKQEEAEKKDV